LDDAGHIPQHIAFVVFLKDFFSAYGVEDDLIEDLCIGAHGFIFIQPLWGWLLVAVTIPDLRPVYVYFLLYQTMSGIRTYDRDYSY